MGFIHQVSPTGTCSIIHKMLLGVILQSRLLCRNLTLWNIYIFPTKEPNCKVNHSLIHLRGPDISLSSAGCHYVADGCDLPASGCISRPPLFKIAPVFLRSSLQLLHWKQRNVCGQDHRGQAAEGIWHPSETWFWRYVELWGYCWRFLQVGLLVQCYLKSLLWWKEEASRKRQGIALKWLLPCHYYASLHISKMAAPQEVGHACRKAIKPSVFSFFFQTRERECIEF